MTIETERENHRRTNGEFGEKTHSAPELKLPQVRAVEELATGDTVVFPKVEKGGVITSVREIHGKVCIEMASNSGRCQFSS